MQYTSVSGWLHAKALVSDCLSPIKTQTLTPNVPSGFSLREPRGNPGTFPPFYRAPTPSFPPHLKNLLLQRHDCITLHDSFLWAQQQQLVAVRRCLFLLLFFLPDKSRGRLKGCRGFLRLDPTMSQSPAAALLCAAETPQAADST